MQRRLKRGCIYRLFDSMTLWILCFIWLFRWLIEEFKRAGLRKVSFIPEVKSSLPAEKHHSNDNLEPWKFPPKHFLSSSAVRTIYHRHRNLLSSHLFQPHLNHSYIYQQKINKMRSIKKQNFIKHICRRRFMTSKFFETGKKLSPIYQGEWKSFR